MELNQSIANLQDEVKLLKGEIKAVLKDLRAAVLSSDNPFTMSAAPPAVQVVRPAASALEPPAADEPRPSPLDEQPAAGNEPVPIRPSKREAAPAPQATEPPAQPAVRWNLLTIAGLTAWAEEALRTLGPQRFQVVLELACLAGLFSMETRDVLRRVAELSPEEPRAEPASVVDCVVVLHRLEALLGGEDGTHRPLHRLAG